MRDSFRQNLTISIERGDNMEEDSFTLKVNFKGKTLEVEVESTTSIEELQFRLAEQTQVLPARQKLMGVKVKLRDDMTMTEAKINAKSKLQLLGTPEADVFTFDESAVEAIEDDYEMAQLPPDKLEVNLKKLEQRVKNVDVEELTPQVHSRLLILDVDYTFFDHRTPNESIAPLTRPGLHDFLERANKEFDIVVWSATGYKWVFLKCKEMGLLDNPRFKIRFLLSERPMFTLEIESRGKLRCVRCKPLAFIWAKYPEYKPEKSIMFDDVRHNFAMNPLNGLIIKPFRNGPSNRDDDELARLGHLLEAIKDHPDFRQLDLKHWSKYLR